jgi:hypothetical protein
MLTIVAHSRSISQFENGLDISSLHLSENAGRQLTLPNSARILDNGHAEWKDNHAKADG